MSKSFVTVETAICPVCGKEEDTGSLFLDPKLTERFERNTCTGYKLCKEHQQLFDTGYVALIEANNTSQANTLKPSEAHRTGRCLHIKRVVLNQIFGNSVSDKQELAFIDTELFNKLAEQCNYARE